MTQRRDRIIALVLAILFFATSVGVSLAVVWQLVWGDDNATVQPIDLNAPLKGTQLSNFTPIEKAQNLEIFDQQVGTGKEVKAGDTIEVDYTGAVAATGIIFESSLDAKQTATLKLVDGPGGVIKGWVEGIVGAKEGGSRRLVIPADKAYGANPPAGIPANADLVFDVTVHGVISNNQE
ncbi:MAG TPA: FKBP-type peptidyl-prolyl cis-trans isomerase [Candidatus Saccharimonadales bacterium]|nr:FKBP-type peptidyl-prolyl cis-trans isomerase [Candidatus Saccharimonadales bacterium]